MDYYLLGQEETPFLTKKIMGSPDQEDNPLRGTNSSVCSIEFKTSIHDSFIIACCCLLLTPPLFTTRHHWHQVTWNLAASVVVSDPVFMIEVFSNLTLIYLLENIGYPFDVFSCSFHKGHALPCLSFHAVHFEIEPLPIRLMVCWRVPHNPH